MIIICSECGREKDSDLNEKCGCEKPLGLTSYPEEGGANLLWEDYRYPYHGDMASTFVKLNDILKRCIFLNLKLVKNIARVFMGNPFNWRKKIVKEFFNWFAGMSGTVFRPVGFLERKRYCPSGQEILRVLDLMYPTEAIELDPNEHQTRCYFKWGIAMMWEYDNAYRFRGQDIFDSLDRKNLLENPKEELIRLFKIGLSRERLLSNDLMTGKWKLAIWLTRATSFLYPGLLITLRGFLLELDIDKVKPDINDWYFMCERWDYDFGGISYKERIKLKKKMDEGFVFKKFPTIKPMETVNDIQEPFLGIQPNKLFWELNKNQAKEMAGNLLETFLNDFEKNKAEVNKGR
jgi:hypothetical protein